MIYCDNSLANYTKKKKIDFVGYFSDNSALKVKEQQT